MVYNCTYKFYAQVTSTCKCLENKANFPKCTGCLIQSDIGITRIAVWKFYCLNSYYRELLEQYFVFSKSARIKLVDYWVFLNSMWTAFYHFLTMFYAWTQYIVDLKKYENVWRYLHIVYNLNITIYVGTSLTTATLIRSVASIFTYNVVTWPPAAWSSIKNGGWL